MNAQGYGDSGSMNAQEYRDSGVESPYDLPKYEAMLAPSMRSKWDFYHWDDTMVNQKGESLEWCLEHYGVGGTYSPKKHIFTATVFLSSEQMPDNAWFLGAKFYDCNTQLPMTDDMYRETPPSTYHLSPSTPLGMQITELLASSMEFGHAGGQRG